MSEEKQAEQLLFDVTKPLANSDVIKASVSEEILESLILCRIAQIKLSILGKSEVLHTSIVKSMHATAEAIRQYDMKIRNKIADVEGRLALSNELRKEKLMDIGELISIAMQISSDKQTDYEDYLYMMTTFLGRLQHTQLQGKPVNTAKYKALMALITEELKADSEGGIPMFDFCDETQELTVQMVHPNNITDAKPGIKWKRH